MDQIHATRAIQRQRLDEDLARNANLLKPDGVADVTKPDAQAGRRLHRSEIMQRLMRLNPDLRYAQSKNYPETGAIYHIRAPYLLEWNADVPGYHVVGIPHVMVNEFDVRKTKQEAVPDWDYPHWNHIQRVDGRERGWRSILLVLLEKGLISPSGIDREFQITKGRSSRTWQESAVN